MSLRLREYRKKKFVLSSYLKIPNPCLLLESLIPLSPPQRPWTYYQPAQELTLSLWIFFSSLLHCPLRFPAAHSSILGLPLVAHLVKNLAAMWETWIRSQGWEDPLEKRKATHSSILARRIPWIIQSMGPQRVRHDRTAFSKIPKLPTNMSVGGFPTMWELLLHNSLPRTSLHP